MKMDPKLVCAIAILIVAFGSAQAANIEDLTIVVDDLDKDISELTYTIILSGSGTETVTLPILEESGGLNAYYKDNFENVEYKKLDSSIDLSIDFGGSGKRTVIVKSFVSDLVKAKNGEKILSLKQEIPKNVSKFELITNLPLGGVVSNVEDSSLVFPEPTNILSDGKIVIFDWQRENPTGNFELFLVYEMRENGTPDIFHFIYFFISVLVVAGIVIPFFILKGKKKVEKVISVGLSEDEKKIYDFVKERGEVNQKEVLKELDFSKPRLSKLIRKLEEKELIEKKPMGRTNILKVKNV